MQGSAEMKATILWTALQIIVRVAGAGLGCFRIFAFLFFASDTPNVIVVPGLILLVLSLTPLRFLAWNRCLIKLLLGLYVFSYFAGGFQRIIEYGQFMPDVLEFFVVLCFCGLVWKQGEIQS